MLMWTYKLLGASLQVYPSYGSKIAYSTRVRTTRFRSGYVVVGITYPIVNMKGRGDYSLVRDTRCWMREVCEHGAGNLYHNDHGTGREDPGVHGISGCAASPHRTGRVLPPNCARGLGRRGSDGAVDAGDLQNWPGSRGRGCDRCVCPLDDHLGRPGRTLRRTGGGL